LKFLVPVKQIILIGACHYNWLLKKWKTVKNITGSEHDVALFCESKALFWPGTDPSFCMPIFPVNNLF
jgi:hypothetical protein